MRIRAGRLTSAAGKSSAKDQAAFVRALASLGSRGGDSSDSEGSEDDDSVSGSDLSSSSDWARDKLDDAALADYAANAGLSDGEDEEGNNARIAALALGGEGRKGAPPKSTRFLDGDLSSDVQFGSSDEEDDEEEEEHSDESNDSDDGDQPSPLQRTDGNLPGPGVGPLPAGTVWQWSTGGQGGPAKKKKAKTAFPGEKARQRKEGIAAKRGERVMQRGFDPRGLADAMRAFIVGNGDMMALKPAGKLELKVTAALAALHGLRCTVQGSGKKRFAVLVMTRHAAVVDARDPRLADLFRATLEQPRDKDDKPCRHKRRQEVVPLSSSVEHKARVRGGSGPPKPKSQRRSATGSGPPGRTMSFVSGGRIGGEDDKPAVSAPMEAAVEEAPIEAAPAAVVADPVPLNRGMRRAQEHLERERLKLERRRGKREPRVREGEDSPTPGLGGSHSAPAPHGEWGAWERSSTGFGSRILASMGYVPGQGLGSTGQGRADPIMVTKRPKAQGLGC